MPAEQRGKFRRQVHVVATAQEYGGFPFTYFRSEESYILDQVDRPVGHGCRRADLNDRDIAGHPFPERAILSNRPQLGRQPRLHGGCCNFYGFGHGPARSEEHTSELQSLMRNSYAVFCLKKKKTIYDN